MCGPVTARPRMIVARSPAFQMSIDVGDSIIKGNDFTAQRRRSRFIHMRPSPGKIIGLTRHTLGDHLHNGGLLRYELPVGDAGIEPLLLFWR